MDNASEVITRSRRPGYGPNASPGRSAPALSRPRSQLLELLRDQSEPVTLSALTELTRSHANTVREHLDALIGLGLARRWAAPPHGRGRPAWLYQATGGAAAPTEYAGLAAALAATIHRTSSDPVGDATEAGVTWGRSLAQERGAAPATGALDARREVVALLADLGFGPSADADVVDVRLTRCPLLEAAHQYPDVVCAVHLGLVNGVLLEHGVDPEGTDLHPFAEPGACRLRLGPTR